MLRHKLAHETILLALHLIGSQSDRIFLLTNRQVVLMGLNLTHRGCEVKQLHLKSTFPLNVTKVIYFT